MDATSVSFLATNSPSSGSSAPDPSSSRSDRSPGSSLGSVFGSIGGSAGDIVEEDTAPIVPDPRAPGFFVNDKLFLVKVSHLPDDITAGELASMKEPELFGPFESVTVEKFPRAVSAIFRYKTRTDQLMAIQSLEGRKGELTEALSKLDAFIAELRHVIMGVAVALKQHGSTDIVELCCFKVTAHPSSYSGRCSRRATRSTRPPVFCSTI